MWLLLDDRAGNSNQVLGLAAAMNIAFQEKHLQYNDFAKLPNIIRGASLMGLSNKEIISPPYPSLLISAGRKSAPIARYIKKQSPSTKLVQIMSPNWGHSDFSLIILPQHDQVKNAPNILQTIGSLHKVTPKLLAIAALKFQDQFAHLAKPYVSLLIGGATAGKEFTLADARDLALMANHLAQKIQGSLLITSSRRTKKQAMDYLLQHLTVPYYNYDFNTKMANPYLAYLALGDYLVVTGDSISMVSECCSTGKPVYIYASANIMSKKHAMFVENLIAQAYAKKLDFTTTSLSFKPQLVLADTAMVAQKVKELLC